MPSPSENLLQSWRSLHPQPIPASSPSGVGAFVEPKIIKKNIEATRGFLGEKDKITLEARRDFYAQAMGNHPSIKSKVPKIGIYL